MGELVFRPAVVFVHLIRLRFVLRNTKSTGRRRRDPSTLHD